MEKNQSQEFPENIEKALASLRKSLSKYDYLADPSKAFGQAKLEPEERETLQELEDDYEHSIKCLLGFMNKCDLPAVLVGRLNVERRRKDVEVSFPESKMHTYYPANELDAVQEFVTAELIERANKHCKCAFPLLEEPYARGFEKIEKLFKQTFESGEPPPRSEIMRAIGEELDGNGNGKGKEE